MVWHTLAVGVLKNIYNEGMYMNTDKAVIELYEKDLKKAQKKLSVFMAIWAIVIANTILAALVLFAELIWAFIFRFNNDYMTDMQFVKYVFSNHTIIWVYILNSLGWCQPILSSINSKTNAHKKIIKNLEERIDYMKGN